MQQFAGGVQTTQVAGGRRSGEIQRRARVDSRGPRTRRSTGGSRRVRNRRRAGGATAAGRSCRRWARATPERQRWAPSRCGARRSRNGRPGADGGHRATRLRQPRSGCGHAAVTLDGEVRAAASYRQAAPAQEARPERVRAYPARAAAPRHVSPSTTVTRAAPPAACRRPEPERVHGQLTTPHALGIQRVLVQRDLRLVNRLRQRRPGSGQQVAAEVIPSNLGLARRTPAVAAARRSGAGTSAAALAHRWVPASRRTVGAAVGSAPAASCGGFRPAPRRRPARRRQWFMPSARAWRESTGATTCARGIGGVSSCARSAPPQAVALAGRTGTRCAAPSPYGPE